MKTHEACAALARALVRSGVREACVSPGSRSTPLALALAEEAGLRVRVHLDERSAAFFALGVAKASRSPTALLCTSGTAAAEYLPAVLEAHLAHVPLIVLTADRPGELQDCGAGQTIDQNGLYGAAVRWFHHLEGPADPRRFAWVGARAVASALSSPRGPVHVNIPLRDPLVPTAPVSSAPIAISVQVARLGAPLQVAMDALAGELAVIERGLIVCGPHDGDDAFGGSLALLAEALGWPVLADGASQLRTGSHGDVIATHDALLRDPVFTAAHVPDTVIRFGATPISKPLNELLARPDIRRQVLVDPEARWNDPWHGATDVLLADDSATCDGLVAALGPGSGHDTRWRRSWRDADRRASEEIRDSLAATGELFEGKVFAELADLLPDGATLCVSNSMPMRDLDAFLPTRRGRLRVLVNRGANGIDGFLSSGLGAAAVSEGPVVIVIGDLALQHDLGGLAAVAREGIRATIVLLNNDGGGIFSFLPQANLPEARFEQLFGTPQGLVFADVARLFGLAHQRPETWPEFRAVLREALGAPFTSLVEIRTERRRNVELHRDVWSRVATALRRERIVT
ncbi:MAG: 2-succinyl-5-enolpyruvyl-6-hydroxy-3-cyclohexene-1-carboxylic-acid synthase [Chloroflexi bacterium]|nr:2-succinyl-5-enolpyruvyl-6-hydroxy-3-cyclohexene-1-carboxylic-acid synthase [Chloroflexota bacterium]